MNNKIPSLNLGASRQVENPQAIRNGIRLARAEAFLMQSAIDTTHTAHNAVFQEDKFCLVATYQTNNYDSGQDVTQTIGIQMKLENFIGLGEDEFDPFKEIKTILSDFLSSPNPAPYVFPLSSQYKSGKIMWSKNMKPKNSICYRTVTDVCLAQIRKDILEHFPKSADGFILPMLGLYAIKLSYLHGHTYSVEAAADELYDLGLVNEPDFDEDHLPSPQLSSEILSPTTPQCFNDFKYQGKRDVYVQWRAFV